MNVITAVAGMDSPRESPNDLEQLHDWTGTWVGGAGVTELTGGGILLLATGTGAREVLLWTDKVWMLGEKWWGVEEFIAGGGIDWVDGEEGLEAGEDGEEGLEDGEEGGVDCEAEEVGWGEEEEVGRGVAVGGVKEELKRMEEKGVDDWAGTE